MCEFLSVICCHAYWVIWLMEWLKNPSEDGITIIEQTFMVLKNRDNCH